MADTLHTLLVQLSDLHIREPGRLAYHKINTADYLQQTVAAIAKLPQQPHAVVITGDLTDFGRLEEYRHLARLLSALPMPVYLVPGNHDDRDNLRAVFTDHAYLGTSGFIQYSVAINQRLQLVALDSTTRHKPYGTLCDARLDWLDNTLQQHCHQPVVVALHHPPFASLIGHMDRQGIVEGLERFERIIARYPNVERVIAGHVHRFCDIRFGGTIASMCGAPAHSVYLDMHPDARSQWSMEPASYRLLALTHNDQVVTHIASALDFDGAYPFHDSNGKLID